MYLPGKPIVAPRTLTFATTIEIRPGGVIQEVPPPVIQKLRPDHERHNALTVAEVAFEYLRPAAVRDLHQLPPLGRVLEIGV